MSPCLKGRGSFMVAMRLDNYKLIIYILDGIYMTSGSRLEMVGFVRVDWRFPRCFDLFWSLPGSLSLFPRPSMAVR
jgi:hypothetical protein